MGGALGYAFTQPPIVTFLVFLFLGIGLALPYIIVTLLPKKLLSFTPRSGQWLLTFKQFLAFPMLATAIWLCWVLTTQTGAHGLVRGLSATLIMGFLFWIMSYKGWKLIKLISIIVILWLAISVKPSVLNTEATDFLSFGNDDFSTLATEQNRPVFVNVTATWCLTCQVNEKAVLSRTKTQELFAAQDVLYVKADWTFRDDVITAYLNKYKRAGVPTYIVYLPGKEAIVLSELLRYRHLAALFDTTKQEQILP